MNFLDLSMYQMNVDYEKASKNLDGVIIRAGFGKGNEDNLFQQHYNGFLKHGVPIGVYWFSYAKTPEEAANEAQYCVSLIHNKFISLPVCYDLEDKSVENAKAFGIKVNKTLATNMAEAFLSTVEKNGYYAMLYANPNFIRNYYADSLLQKYDLWLAHYVKYPEFGKPSRECGIWQYGTGEWYGISGPVDLDFAYKDYPKIIREAGLNHLPSAEPIYLELWKSWAVSNGLVKLEDCDKSATIGDLAKMLYSYHMIYTPADDSFGGLVKE